MSTSHTFCSQASVDASSIMAALRAAGYPLSSSTDAAEGESDASKLVCIADVRESMMHAIVATPSGIVQRFEPSQFEPQFWSFACRHYYLVTGNIADRRRAAELAGVEIKDVKGRTLLRGKSEDLSGMTLDGMLANIGLIQEPIQTSLFDFG